MKSTNFLVLLLSAFTLTLFSCSKDDSKGPDDDITGTYDFVSIHVKGVNDQTMSFMGEQSRVKSEFEYTSENNKGTVEVDSKFFTGTGIAYTINSTSRVYIYDGDQITDTEDMPFVADVPESDGKSGYTITGKSKIKMEPGSVFMGGNQELASQGLEGTYSFSGDVLTITTTLNKETNDNTDGMIITGEINADVVIVLRRK